jgi:hypothetical protein
MHVGILQQGDRDDDLYDLMEAFCIERGQQPDRGMMPHTIPWYIPNYRMWGLFDGDRLVGFMDGVPIAVMYWPFYIGLVQWFYVEHPYREHSWRLVREGLRYAKRLGIGSITITSGLDTERFWMKHRFERKTIHMERQLC